MGAIVSTIKGFGTKTIATLIAYYWDIKRFKTLNQFKGYMLKGTIREQSGQTINRIKNLKSRPEVKKVLYLLWKQTARRKNNPLRHLVKLSYEINKKKAWIKFADKLLELVYYMLKYRLTFAEAVEYSVKNKEKEIKNLTKQLSKKLKEEQKQEYFKKLVKLQHLIKNWVAYQDTALELKEGATELCHPTPKTLLKQTLSLLEPNELKTLAINLQLLDSELTNPLKETLQ